MIKTTTNQTLALAGIFQAAAQVRRLANEGRTDNAEFETMVGSLFVTDPKETLEVYGGIHSLHAGLRSLITNLGSETRQREAETTRYVITLLHLERKLASRKDLVETIGRGIENARRQSEHFSPTHPNVIASLADIYVNTISTLSPRIMVSGQHNYLQQPDIANRVRTLLLAGIRSAVLWSQVGGGRLRLLFTRGKYLAEAQRLLRSA